MAAAPSAFKARRALPLTTAALLLIMRGVTCLILAACGATAAENAVNRKLLLSNSKGLVHHGWCVDGPAPYVTSKPKHR